MEYNFNSKYLNGVNLIERIRVTDEFIIKNNFKLLPIKEIAKLDLTEVDDLSYKQEVLISFLSWEFAKEYFNPLYIAAVEGENPEFTYTYISTLPEAVQDFLDCMVYTWDKSYRERNIAIERGLQKLAMYAKCLSRLDLLECFEDITLYPMFARPILIKVAEILEIKYPEYLKN